MIILNRKIRNIFKKFKTDNKKFTETLKIDENIERIVTENEKLFTDPVMHGNYFAAIYGYYTRTFDIIIMHAQWALKMSLESKNCPPIKPKYQFLFRTALHNHIVGLINNAIDNVEPTMVRFGMDTNPTGAKLDIQMQIFKILYSQDSKIDNIFTSMFSNYNVTIRPFKDSVRSTVAIILSILGFLLTIMINFRNEIWNLIFKPHA